MEPDFRVRYRLFTREEGGRRGLPIQEYRCDWFYDGDDIKDGIWIIHPLFEDADGILLDKGQYALPEGYARMRILSAQLRGQIHRKRIHIGTRGFFMEGSKKVAEATVTEILALFTNPIE